jgi:FixJ family two-component response regulator
VRETVHIVDPALEECARLAGTLAEDAVCVRTWESSEKFFEGCGTTASGCVLAPADLPGAGVRGLIDEISKRGLALAVLVIGRTHDLDTAVALVRAGAADFLESPLSERRLRSAVRRAIGADLA